MMARPIFAEMIDSLEDGDSDDRAEAEALLELRRAVGRIESLLGSLTAFSEDEARGQILDRLKSI